MAEVDKGLPSNTRTKIDVPTEEEIEEVSVKEEEVEKGPVEVTPEEDGGATIDFEPGAINIPGTENHFDNLADILPEDVLQPVGNDMVGDYNDYKASRKEWEQSYRDGLDLLGFKYQDRSEPFQGASGATHPVLAEAVTQFQAQAYKELLPGDGPVRTQVVGIQTPANDLQAQRVKDYMNYLVMDEMEEYEPEFDSMLFHLPLAGSTFKKIYYDTTMGRAVSKFVPADELVVPYTATSLDDAQSIIHVIKMPENELRKLECHVNLDLEGFEEVGEDGQPTGIKLPYVVTIDESTRTVLSIRRNYAPDDPKKNKIQYFVHFKFLPGLGFYGFGLIHMIGGLSRTAKEPSPTLLQLLGIVVQAGQRFASIAEIQVGDGNQNAAVGTTIALLERGSRVMSAIHKRLYAAMKKEFRLLADIVSKYLPPEYPYDVVGGARTIKQLDFDDRVDIIPVADPNIFSMSQRITLAQTELQLATANPGMHNMYNIYRNMYEAIGVKNIDSILPPPAPNAPKDPALENIDALGGKPFQAFPGQDHRAHITSHLNFMATNMVRNNPPVMAALQKNILEHISLMAQEQIQLEFREQLQTMQMLQQQAPSNPQAANELQVMSQAVEARKAVLIAEMTEDFMKEEKKITSTFDNDPLLKLKSREVDLRAMENERKKQYDDERINIDKAKLVQQRDLTEDKLEQNEELAELRADTSLTKQAMSNAAKLDNDLMKMADVKILKGPKT